MTLTSRSIGWLNYNRHRSYPMKRDEWREKVSPKSGLDCVILDAMVFNCDASAMEKLEVSSISVTNEGTEVSMKYGDRQFAVNLSGQGTDDGFESVRMVLDGDGGRKVTMSFSFSSHEYILENVGTGTWDLGVGILESRVVNISDGFGVDGIRTNGSDGVEDRWSASVADGDVVLEDGYRTSPVVMNGEVLVRVGKKYGLNPCHYDYGKGGGTDCASPLFFFCGQNAINSGNISISGGRGVTVRQGGTYTMRDGDLEGRKIPCVEIIANSELLSIYKPGECELVREDGED